MRRRRSLLAVVRPSQLHASLLRPPLLAVERALRTLPSPLPSDVCGDLEMPTFGVPGGSPAARAATHDNHKNPLQEIYMK